MIKIASIVGARPQFIKAAVISSRLRAHPEIEETLIHTGQHYSQTMSDVFFEQLEIPRPDVNLGVGKATPAAQIGNTLIRLDSVFKSEPFDWVLVYGDTNSTMAGALAAVKAGIPLAHVEAGLRSYDRKMPEEVNRLTTDHLSDLLFTPTKTADANLQKEGIPAQRIARVGDVMYDSVLYYRERAHRHAHILEDLGLKSKGYLVCTVHRAENTDDIHKLEVILSSLKIASQDVNIVFPLHPRTRAAMDEHNLMEMVPPTVRLIDPVGYLDMLQLEANAKLIITDSGGVQKEAYFLSVPCVILRRETEWVELLESGQHRLAPPEDAEAVASILSAALLQVEPENSDSSLFGDGHAAEKIRDLLVKAS